MQKIANRFQNLLGPNLLSYYSTICTELTLHFCAKCYKFFKLLTFFSKLGCSKLAYLRKQIQHAYLPYFPEY